MATKKGRGKRKATAKQKAALAKGRAKLASAWKRKTVRKKAFTKITLSGAKKRRSTKTKRTRRAHSPAISGGETLIFTEGGRGMAKRRSRKRRTTRKASRRRYMGVDIAGGRKRVRRSRRRVRYMGGFGGKSKGIMALVMNGVAAGAGAIGGAFAAGKLPIANPKLKALVPIALGIGLGMTKFGKKPVMQSVSLGLIAGGTLALVRQFAPNLPMLAGDDDYTTMGITEQLGSDSMVGMGIPEAIGEEGVLSPADM